MFLVTNLLRHNIQDGRQNDQLYQLDIIDHFGQILIIKIWLNLQSYSKQRVYFVCFFHYIFTVKIFALQRTSFISNRYI